MSDLIYKRFSKHVWQKDWNKLSESERADYLSKVDQSLQAVGGNRAVLVLCTSAYAIENWNTLGLEIFPDIKAVEKHSELLKQLNWSEYVKSEGTTGTEQDLLNWLEFTLQE